MDKREKEAPRHAGKTNEIEYLDTRFLILQHDEFPKRPLEVLQHNNHTELQKCVVYLDETTI